ncbi:MAG: hypothetical protein NT132_09995 [Microbacterium sp.]|uniref:hypothetical protein n=1 Tax=Microbacterium sp. TaxID=51671 RepID=UPI00263356F6|nr:hypothetical protein [Microbacterium sp.]MCX6502715.1 hypothetical protein [Microbacterium sp.]
MTLTDILPTLRYSLPAPLVIDHWPQSTEPTTSDIVMAGVSMLRYAELCGTPCVHAGPAVIPGTKGRPSSTADCSVIVTAVLTVDAGDAVAQTAVRLDASFSRTTPVWAEARVIGRVSIAPHRAMTALGAGDTSAAAVMLPVDIRPGDLIALPCPGLIVLRDLHTPSTPHPAVTDGEEAEDAPLCGRHIRR